MAVFEEFSAGYYIGQLYVEPHTGEHGVMDRAQHAAANEQVYATGEGVERLDHPLVMKMDGRYFPVLGDDVVPADTVAVPDAVLDPTALDDLPALKEVLVVKADRAPQLLEWCSPYTVEEPDMA